MSAEEAVLAQKLTNAQAVKQDKAAVGAQKAASGVNELKAAQQAYSQLTNAYRQYNAAVKNGNETGQAYWDQSAQNALQEIRVVEQKIGSMNIEESVRKRILTLIEQAKNAEATHNKTLSDHNGKVSELEKSLDKVGSRILLLGLRRNTMTFSMRSASSAERRSPRPTNRARGIALLPGK